MWGGGGGGGEVGVWILPNGGQEQSGFGILIYGSGGEGGGGWRDDFLPVAKLDSWPFSCAVASVKRKNAREYYFVKRGKTRDSVATREMPSGFGLTHRHLRNEERFYQILAARLGKGGGKGSGRTSLR